MAMTRLGFAILLCVIADFSTGAEAADAGYFLVNDIASGTLQVYCDAYARNGALLENYFTTILMHGNSMLYTVLDGSTYVECAFLLEMLPSSVFKQQLPMWSTNDDPYHTVPVFCGIGSITDVCNWGITFPGGFFVDDHWVDGWKPVGRLHNQFPGYSAD